MTDSVLVPWGKGGSM